MLIQLLVMASQAVTQPIDLRQTANADPLSDQSLFLQQAVALTPSYLWLEGESVWRREGGEIEKRAAASNGSLLANLGASAHEWAAFNFDLPWQSENAHLYLRCARDSGAAAAELAVSLDGGASIAATVPQTGGPGDRDADFELGVCRIKIGRMLMGRHVIRIDITSPGSTLHLDGAWLGDGPLDIWNRIIAPGKLLPPRNRHSLIYSPGQRKVQDVTFDLIDPIANERRAVILGKPLEPLAIPCGGVAAKTVYLLAAGVNLRDDRYLNDVGKAKLRLHYDSGDSSEHEIELRQFFIRDSRNYALSLGPNRAAYIVSAPVEARPLKSIEIAEASQAFVILAASYEPVS